MKKKSVKKHTSKKKPVKKKKTTHKKHSSAKRSSFGTEKEVAMDFAIKVHRKFNHLIKASILFGSQTKNTATSTSDIDIILLIDDSAIQWDLELIAWYREELGKLIANLEYGKDLHINTVKLTTWWNDLMAGDPVVINILRYGEALIDSGGFFNPLKILLRKGKIHSTAESVYTALRRSPMHLLRSKLAVLNSIEGVYWSMVDAAQAALIMAGKLPPSPEHLPGMLKQTFVDKGLLKIDMVRALRDLYVMHRKITHKELTNVAGSEIDKWHGVAEKFLSQMTKLIDDLLKARKTEDMSEFSEDHKGFKDEDLV